MIYKIKNEDIIKIKYTFFQNSYDFSDLIMPKWKSITNTNEAFWFSSFQNSVLHLYWPGVLRRRLPVCMQCLMLWWPQTSCKSVTNLKHTQLVTSLWLYIIKCSSQLCMITFKKRQKAIHIYIQNKKKV